MRSPVSTIVANLYMWEVEMRDVGDLVLKLTEKVKQISAFHLTLTIGIKNPGFLKNCRKEHFVLSYDQNIRSLS